MTGEEFGALVEHRLALGLRVKLDKGFVDGVWCVYVEYDELAERVGFGAARHKARDYCARLKRQLDRGEGSDGGPTEDPSLAAETGRKSDLESTFLSFPLTRGGGQFHDTAMKEQFRVALLRTAQEWDQLLARNEVLRRARRRSEFEQRLGQALAGEAYRHVDAVTKERLIAEVWRFSLKPRSGSCRLCRVVLWSSTAMPSAFRFMRKTIGITLHIDGSDATGAGSAACNQLLDQHLLVRARNGERYLNHRFSRGRSVRLDRERFDADLLCLEGGRTVAFDDLPDRLDMIFWDGTRQDHMQRWRQGSIEIQVIGPLLPQVVVISKSLGSEEFRELLLAEGRERNLMLR
jgi:hypothetical protein